MSPVDREWLRGLVALNAVGEDLSHIRASDLLPTVRDLLAELDKWKTITDELTKALAGDTVRAERDEMEGQMSIDEVTS